jgi:hypothetical protein
VSGCGDRAIAGDEIGQACVGGEECKRIHVSESRYGRWYFIIVKITLVIMTLYSERKVLFR